MSFEGSPHTRAALTARIYTEGVRDAPRPLRGGVTDCDCKEMTRERRLRSERALAVPR